MARYCMSVQVFSSTRNGLQVEAVTSAVNCTHQIPLHDKYKSNCIMQ